MPSSYVISLVLSLHFSAFAASCAHTCNGLPPSSDVLGLDTGEHVASGLRIRGPLQLRGGGKFPLKRMMRHNVNNMSREQRVASLEEIHKLMPFLDEGTDPLTREVLKERERKKQQQEWAAAKALKRQAREKKTKKESAPLPPTPTHTIHLPKLRSGASLVEMARALEPLVLRPRPNTRLVPQEAAAAMAALASALLQPPPPPTSVRRLSLRAIDHLASVVAPSLQNAQLSQSAPAINAVACLRSEKMDMGPGCKALAQKVFRRVAKGPGICLLAEEDLRGLCVLLQQAAEDGILPEQNATTGAERDQNTTGSSDPTPDSGGTGGSGDVQDQTSATTTEPGLEALKRVVAHQVAAVAMRLPKSSASSSTVRAVLGLFEALAQPLPNKLADHLQPRQSILTGESSGVTTRTGRAERVKQQ